MAERTLKLFLEFIRYCGDHTIKQMSFIKTIVSHVGSHLDVWSFGVGIIGLFLSVGIFLVGVYISIQLSDATDAKIGQVQKSSVDIHESMTQGFAKINESIETLNKRNMVTVIQALVSPPLKIFTEDPFSEYRCFDFVRLRVVKEDAEILTVDNDIGDPSVYLRFSYSKKTGEITMDFDDLKYNPQSSHSSYENALAYWRFEQAIFRNAKLVFWNLQEDKPFLKTGATLPTNMNYDYEKAKPVMDLLTDIVRIEHKFGKSFPYRAQVDKATVLKVAQIVRAISDKPIQIGAEYEFHLQNHEEKKKFLSKFFKGGPQGTEYAYGGEDVVEIFDQKINLGPYQINFPPVSISPSLEDLSRDGSDSPVTVKLKSLNTDKPIIQRYSTLFRQDTL